MRRGVACLHPSCPLVLFAAEPHQTLPSEVWLTEIVAVHWILLTDCLASLFIELRGSHLPGMVFLPFVLWQRTPSEEYHKQIAPSSADLSGPAGTGLFADLPLLQSRVATA